MARLKEVPHCEDHGFNVRAIHVETDEHEEWFCYEVYPRGEKHRRNIIGVVEVLTKPLVFVRPAGPLV